MRGTLGFRSRLHLPNSRMYRCTSMWRRHFEYGYDNEACLPRLLYQTGAVKARSSPIVRLPFPRSAIERDEQGMQGCLLCLRPQVGQPLKWVRDGKKGEKDLLFSHQLGGIYRMVKV